MKKIISIMTLLVVFLFVIGCTQVQPEPKPQPMPEPEPEPQPQPEPEPQPEPQPKPQPKQSEQIMLNEQVYEEEIMLDSFPKEKSLMLEEGMKYLITFEADKDIQFIIYAEEKYNEWKQTGYHTTAKYNTKGKTCCKMSDSYQIDINNGEAGKYYLVFDDALINDKANLPTKAKITITKTAKI